VERVFGSRYCNSTVKALDLQLKTPGNVNLEVQKLLLEEVMIVKKFKRLLLEENL
jgi:hypothetical protein